jgi:uncharacterized protein YhaN
MRFASLRLEQYGLYKSRTLDLTDALSDSSAKGPGLVVIHGPNEQGKSTCLAAIKDFLFGIPHTSVHGQVFGYDRMRVFATLQLASGRQAALQRKKGKGSSKTLLNEDGTPADEAALASALATMTRQRFESLFGLDHESLRAGGQQLLSADGDIGRLIVEAGGGLKALTTAIDRLSAEADTLFATRRANDRAFYKAYDAYMEADAAVKEGLLTHDAYQEALDRHASATSAISALHEAQATLRQRQFQLKRLERVMPVLVEIDALDRRISQFSNLPDLGEGFPDEAGNALGRHASLQEQHVATENVRKDHEAELAGLSCCPLLLSLEADIRDAAEQAVHAAKAKTDRTEAERALAESHGELLSLRNSLHLEADADLALLVPAMSSLLRLQELAAEGAQLQGELDSAVEQARNADATRTSLLGQLEDHRGSGTDRSHGFVMAELAGLSSLVPLLDERKKQRDALSEDIAATLKAHGLESLQALRRMALPDQATLQQEIDSRSRLDAALEKLSVAVQAGTLAQEKARASIARLTSGSSVPTDAAIHVARLDRTAALKPVKQAYLAADPAALLQVSLEERSEKVLSLERSIAEVDSLAERKSTEANRIAELELAEKAALDAGVEIDHATREIRQLEQKRDAAIAAWRQAWPDLAGFDGTSALSKCRAFLAAGTRLLELADRAAALDAEIGRLHAESGARMELLCQVEAAFKLSVDIFSTLVDRLRAASQAAELHERRHDDYLHAKNRLVAAEQEHQHYSTLAAQLRDRQQTWKSEWAGAALSLHLPADMPPQRANRVATEWASAKGVLEKISLLQGRLDDMNALDDALKQKLADIAAKVDFALPDDCFAAVDMLKEKLKAAVDAERTKNGLLPKLALSQSACEDAAQRVASSLQQLQALAHKAGCALQELASTAALYRDLYAVKAQQRQKMDNLQIAGDGFSRAELQAQLQERSIDQIRVELAQIDDEDSRLHAGIRQAIENAQECRQRLQQFDCESSAMDIVSGRESAAAEMHQVIERYLEVALARELLSAAVNQIRAEHQDPLIRRAGELLSLATNGAFSAVGTDVDDKGNPVVVALRNNGDPAAIDTLSDGTRDQLFLAFRIASIENYCTAAEPLPFIADDLLVHFDDARSEACLKLLAELGRKTQVLLFTHHQSVADAAKRLAAQGECTLAELV